MRFSFIPKMAAVSVFFVVGCAHSGDVTSTQTKAEKKPIKMTTYTDSRLAKVGSPASRGVQVIRLRTKEEAETSDVGRALKQTNAAPVVDTPR